MQVEQGPLHSVAGSLVKRCRRLIEQQHRGLQRQRSRQHHALLLANRKLPRGSLTERAVKTSQ